MKKTIVVLSLMGIVASCATIKQSGENTKTEQNLNSYLTAQNEYVQIPLKKLPSGHLHLTATVNGVKGDFILDTGASATVVDPKGKAKFNLTAGDSQSTGAGAGGQTSVTMSTSDSFMIGDLEKKEFTLYLMDLNHVNSALTGMGLDPVDGVVGGDILDANNGIIDYANLVLYLKR